MGEGLDVSGLMPAERRIVTAVFVDIAGSTSITESLDPEDARDLIGGALELVIEQVDALGGTVKDLAGDGVLALFGAPVAHEDDAERAVVCGLRVVAAVAEYSRTAAARWRVGDLSVRVGIETGPAVLGPVGSGSHVEYGAVGDALNTAARLQSQADLRTVLVGEATRAMVEDRFAWGPGQILHLRGRSGVVRASPVLAHASHRRRSGSAGTVDSPFVGRVAALADVRCALDDLRAGQGRVVVVTGEAGLGKSRLVAEARRVFLATGGGLWLEGASPSYGAAVPYLTYRHLLLSWLGLPLDASSERALAATRRRAGELSVRAANALVRLGAVVAPGAPEASVSSGAGQRGVFAAASTLIAELAGTEPVVVVLEDLHWCDATSLDLTEHLAALVPAQQLLLVLTSRDEPVGTGLIARLGVAGPDRLRTVELSPLTGDADRSLLHGLLGGPVLPRVLEQRLLSASQGNPLFIEEQVRSLIASGAISGAETGWRFVGEGPLHLAPTVQRALVARIDRLDVGVRDVLLAASVLGPRFSRNLLSTVLGRQPDEALRSLVSDQFLLADRTAGDEGSTHRFRHALVREAAYGCLVRRRLVELHARAAAALAAEYAGRQEEVAATLGRHLAAAGQPDSAVTHLLVAVRQAVAVFANDEAAALAREALALLGPEPADVADGRRPVARDVAMVRATSLAQLSRHDEALTALAQALALTPAADALAIAEVHTARGASLRETHRYGDALAEFDTAERCLGGRFQSRQEFARWLDVQLGRAVVFYWQGDVASYDALLHRVEPRISELATDAQRARFYDSARGMLYRRERYAMTEEILRLDGLVYEAGRSTGGPADQAWGAFYHAFTLLWHRNLDEAERLLRESAAAADRLGDMLLRSRSLTYLMVAARLRGGVAEVVRLLDVVVEAAREARLPEYEAVAGSMGAWVAYRHGDRAGTITNGHLALARWRSLPSPYFLDWLVCLPLMAVALETDDLPAALESAASMLAETQQRLSAPVEAALRAGVRAGEIGAGPDARDRLREAVRLAGQSGWL